MRNILRRHFVLLMVAAVLLVLTSTYLSIYAKKDAGSFALQDLEGDRSVLKEVTLSGVLADGVHRTDFAMVNGAMATDTTLKPYAENTGQSYYNPLEPIKLSDGRIYYARLEAFSEYTIRAKDEQNRRDKGVATVRPALYYRKYSAGVSQEPNSGFMQNGATQTSSNSGSSTQSNVEGAGTDTSYSYGDYELANQLEYGLTEASGDVYFIVPTNVKWEGVNGIHKLVFHTDGSKDASKEEPESPAIVSIDLDAAKANGSSGLNILGLESVGGKLVLIVVDNGQLQARCFDSETGELLGEVVLAEQFRASRQQETSVNIGEGSYMENYLAYPDEEQSQLSLSFDRYPTEPGATGSTVWTLDLNGDPKVVNQADIQLSADDGEDNRYNSLTAMAYRHNRLYLVKVMDERRNREEPSFMPVLPKRFLLYVYERHTLVYKGEWMTDANDDRIKARNLPPSSSFATNPWEYRNYFAIRIH